MASGLLRGIASELLGRVSGVKQLRYEGVTIAGSEGSEVGLVGFWGRWPLDLCADVPRGPVAIQGGMFAPWEGADVPMRDRESVDRDVCTTFGQVDALISQIAGRQRSLITRGQLRELGIGRRAIDYAVARDRLHRMHLGVGAVRARGGSSPGLRRTVR